VHRTVAACARTVHDVCKTFAGPSKPLYQSQIKPGAPIAERPRVYGAFWRLRSLQGSNEVPFAAWRGSIPDADEPWRFAPEARRNRILVVGAARSAKGVLVQASRTPRCRRSAAASLLPRACPTGRPTNFQIGTQDARSAPGRCAEALECGGCAACGRCPSGRVQRSPPRGRRGRQAT
jgi:hypothetical protein